MPLRHLYSVRHNDHRILPILYLLGSEVSYSMEDKGKRLALTAWNSEGEIYRLRSSCSAKYRTWARPVLPWVDMTIKSLRSFSASSKIWLPASPPPIFFIKPP